MAKEYEFKCAQCDLTTILGDHTIHPDCKKCGKEMKRIYSLGGTIFRGAGFYRNDKSS